MPWKPFWLSFRILASLGICAAAPAPGSPPAQVVTTQPGVVAVQPLPPAELEAFVDGVVRQSMDDKHIAGASVSVVQGGKILLKKGYGFARLAPAQPVDPDTTLFRIGSISKTFTWILALKEVEAGRMRLDGPINLYLPESLRIPDQGFSQPIRLRDLMNHTPGFEDRALGQLFERDPNRVRPLNLYLRQERPQRVREPEALVSYSNYGTGLAGAALAEVSGKPYETLVETDITGPLGMSHTSFREPRAPRGGLPAPINRALAGQMADGFRWTSGGFEKQSFEYIGQIAPAGAGSSTAADMARYMLMLLGNGTLDGVQIYGPATATAFSTPLPVQAPGVAAWRHGLNEIGLPGGMTGVGHGGDTLAFHSMLVLVPKLNLGIFVTTNSDQGWTLAADLPRQVIGRFYTSGPLAPAAGSPGLIENAAAFAGTYLSNRRAYHGLEGLVDRISGTSTVSVTATGRLLVSGFDGSSRFTLDGPIEQGRFLSETGDKHIVFQLRNGRATRFFSTAGANAFERAPLWRWPLVLAIMTASVLVASLLCLRDLLVRMRREVRQTTTQARAGVILATQATLWIVSAGLFGLWASGTGDVPRVMYTWPGVSLVIASTCALVASLLCVPGIGLLPFVWRGGRRVDSWSGWRKTDYVIKSALFLIYAVLLATWGALEPWSR